MIIIISIMIAITTLWWLIFIIISQLYFDKKTRKNINKIDIKDEALQKRKEYHNKAIYRDFELFIQICISILGGMSIVAWKSVIPAKTKAFLYFGGYCILGIAILFSLLIILHRIAKIKCWEDKPKWYEPLLTGDLLMIEAMFFVASITLFYLIRIVLDSLHLWNK